ncbi:MAG: TrkA family potassium uptake protein [Syntrophorhabdaceae bacterium]|nr:TrkA family potassium uptake protein [Syntrophorhabdales bacterium]MBP9560914.1 TrkA family potassium uptake protein [Syntrophorhabdaceae bacterium]
MPRVIVIGLGIFGYNVVKNLFEAGIDVIAVDKNKDAVQQARDCSTKAILGDGTDKNLIETIGIREDDIVIVSFGEDLAASTLLTLHLKQIKVKNIIVKAPNEEHKLVLEKVGATEVVIPEKDMAAKVARSIIAPNLIDYIPISDEFMICEVAPSNKFIGKSLREVHMRSNYGVDVVAIKDTLTDTVHMVNPDYRMKDSDILVVIGKTQNVERLK